MERIPPSRKLRQEVEALLGGWDNRGHPLDALVRLGARYMLQAALEAEVEESPGRAITSGGSCIASQLQADPFWHGFFASLDHPQVGQTRLVTTPVGFKQAPAAIRGASPEVGQHTEEVLLQPGHSWEGIARLK